MAKPPQWKIMIAEAPSRHAFEKHPRYRVLLNGDPAPGVEDIYYNLTGYRGAVPMIDGTMFDPGERGISAFREAARISNREAAVAIESSMNDPLVSHVFLATDHPKYMLGRFVPREGGCEVVERVVRADHAGRVAMVFGKAVGVGASMFHEAEIPAPDLAEMKRHLAGMAERHPDHHAARLAAEFDELSVPDWSREDVEAILDLAEADRADVMRDPVPAIRVERFATRRFPAPEQDASPSP